ncbi:MAG: hypothetical protein ABSH45_09155 [Bryobacteraceae bacterium]|jgi:hypothetical protein
MKDTGKSDTAATTGCEEESQSQETPKGRMLSEFLATLRTNIEDRLKKKEVKPSIGDYLKVLQLEKELEKQDAEEVRATWVEPKESVTEK